MHLALTLPLTITQMNLSLTFTLLNKGEERRDLVLVLEQDNNPTGNQDNGVVMITRMEITTKVDGVHLVGQMKLVQLTVLVLLLFIVLLEEERLLLLLKLVVTGIHLKDTL